VHCDVSETADVPVIAQDAATESHATVQRSTNDDHRGHGTWGSERLRFTVLALRYWQHTTHDWHATVSPVTRVQWLCSISHTASYYNGFSSSSHLTKKLKTKKIAFTHLCSLMFSGPTPRRYLFDSNNINPWQFRTIEIEPGCQKILKSTNLVTETQTIENSLNILTDPKKKKQKKNKLVILRNKFYR